MFKLVIQDDEGKTTVIPLIRNEITIGRKEGNTIRLTERNVSRHHARILSQNGEVQIEDLGSYNGIRVNNARIAERVALRVSDQVQIGDYKLYLKAEGVEQADEGRTVPMERVDVGHPPEMSAVPAPNGNGTPTVPMGIPQPVMPGVAPPATSAQIGASPNRTPVAIADTDPAGRPIATAAAVAAMSAPVGYGKLVVLSSNFAGKEFELSRPQMIIGRTDENDIVINHRSISRNHAKLVREPDTGRYTISDLQSSNGVRVNGQDYGKVELRRGDVVDLGHVRLRFIEPGEDFLFARDAVITDVPDAGGRKGLFAAILLGVLVLGGVGAFMMMKSGDDQEQVVEPGSGTNGANEVDGSGSQVAARGSGEVVKDPNNVAAPPPEIDAGAGTTTNTTTTTTTAAADDVKLECLKLAAERSWAKLLDCSDRLASSDPTSSKELRRKATSENKVESTKRLLEDAIKKGNWKVAKAELEKIPPNSVYRRESEGMYESAVEPVINDYEARAKAAGSGDKCERIVREAINKGVGEKARGVRCQSSVAVKPPSNGGTTTTTTTTTTNNTTNNTTTTTSPPPKPECDADALKEKGQQYLQTGMDAAALAAFEASLRCKPDSGILKLAFMAACRANKPDKAKLYYSKLPQAGTLAQICISRGIQVP